MKNKIKILLMICIFSLAYTGCSNGKNQSDNSQVEQQQTEEPQTEEQPVQDESDGEIIQEYEESDLEL